MSKNLSKDQQTKLNEEPFLNPTTYKTWRHNSDLCTAVSRKPRIKDELINSRILYSKKAITKRLDKTRPISAYESESEYED